MIAEFKSPTRLTVLLSAILVAAICSFTFTKAAIKETKAEGPKADLPAVVDAVERTSRRSEPGKDLIAILEEQVRLQEAELKKAVEKVDQMRATLQIPDYQSALLMTPETVLMIERDRIMAKSLQAQYESTYASLKKMDKEGLRNAIPTAAPNNLLNELLNRLTIAKNEITTVSHEFGPQHPKMLQLTSLIANLNADIDARIEGILTGLSVQAKAQEARAEKLAEEEVFTIRRDAEINKKYGPFFQAKRELETQQRIYDTIKLRLLQETVDAAIPAHPNSQSLSVGAALAKPSPRNVNLPVPLTRSLVSFVAADPSRPHDYDRIVKVNAKSELVGEAQSDKIIANLKGGGAPRFVAVRISLISGSDLFIKSLNENYDRLFDLVSGELAALSPEEIEKPGFRNLFRSKLQAQFNRFFESDMVKQVLITEFVVQ